MSDSRQPCVMTIAGTDSSGGAGVQADLKTFAALGCYGTSTITAMTAQNTQGVQMVQSVPPDFVQQQLNSVLDDIPIVSMKTGMLFDTITINALVTALKSRYPADIPIPPIICDPVCVSTSGHSLLKAEAIETLIKKLFPLTDLITPNISEAELILRSSSHSADFSIESLDSMVQAAKDLSKLGPKAALVKGGHFDPTLDQVISYCSIHTEVKLLRDSGLQGDLYEILKTHRPTQATVLSIVLDVLYDSETQMTIFFARPRIESMSTHGTGCTLSAAIASYMACGHSLIESIRLAGAFTHRGIETAQPIGKGHGPLNHLHSVTTSVIPRPTPSNPYPFTQLLIARSSEIWKEYVQHEFVALLGKGTLPQENFIHFMKQDYHYLKYYARGYSLLAAKSSTFNSIKIATDTILNVLHEVEGTHLKYCEELGVSREDLDSTPESGATMAYGAFILDTGFQGDTSKLLMSLLACLLGYGEVGLWLKKSMHTLYGTEDLTNHPYRKWIEDYSGEHYQGAVKAGLDVIENMALRDPPSQLRLDEWEAIWAKCTLLEKRFWDAAMDMRV